MSANIKILLVEDSDSDIQTCKDSIKVYERENSCKIDLNVHKALESAAESLDNTFDGAIVDLNLKDEEGGTPVYEGNEVIKLIHDDYRIPVAILTGTPSHVQDSKPGFIGIFKKGEVKYSELLAEFSGIHKTGLTRIFGGRGIIENSMRDIFWDNILPQINSWKDHATTCSTENSLLRLTLNHLIEILENNDTHCFPEEMYISPPISKTIKTGSIVECNTTKKLYTILSPACDLALRSNGVYKTDRILVCRIEEFDPIKEEITNGVGNKKKPRKIKELISNNSTIYYHWLPQAGNFPGGVINFRKSETYKPEEFEILFNTPQFQISSHFIKDIVARYSSFYARQGQPAFDFEKISEELST